MKTAMEVRTMYEQMMPFGFDKALPGSLANAFVEMMVSQYMHLQQEFKDLLALVQPQAYAYVVRYSEYSKDLDVFGLGPFKDCEGCLFVSKSAGLAMLCAQHSGPEFAAAALAQADLNNFGPAFMAEVKARMAADDDDEDPEPQVDVYDGRSRK